MGIKQRKKQPGWTPKKLRLQRTVGKAILDSITDPHALTENEEICARWAVAASEGSDVRIWQPGSHSWYVQSDGVQRQITRLHVREFHAMLQKAINFHMERMVPEDVPVKNWRAYSHEPPVWEVVRQLRHRRNILDLWLGLDAITRLAGVAK